MLAHIRVDHAEGFPGMCIACDNRTGPFVLTHKKLPPPMGTVYVCQRCVKTWAQLMGFTKGDRADELENAAEIADAAKADLERSKAKIEDERKKVDYWKQRWEEDTGEVSVLRGRVVQLEERLRERAEADLALTYNDAA